MARKNYTLHEVICPACGTLNTYELPTTDEPFEGRPLRIWANNKRLQPGERSFPCSGCKRPIEISS
jgi:hypothetical protein